MVYNKARIKNRYLARTFLACLTSCSSNSLADKFSTFCVIWDQIRAEKSFYCETWTCFEMAIKLWHLSNITWLSYPINYMNTKKYSILQKVLMFLRTTKDQSLFITCKKTNKQTWNRNLGWASSLEAPSIKIVGT